MGRSILIDGIRAICQINWLVVKKKYKSQIKPPLMDRYASGHKQAVLKAVQWPKKSPVGSNPILSVVRIVKND